MFGRFDANKADDPVAAQFGLKSDFYYGWKTSPATIPITGSAKYLNVIGGTLYLSDGRRLFGGRVELNADFAKSTVDGILFRNLLKGDPGNQLMKVQVDLAGGQLGPDGTITGGSVTINPTNFSDNRNSFDPAYTNLDGAPFIQSSQIAGELVGPAANALIGAYEMKGTVTRGGISETISAHGSFNGNRQ